MVYRRSHRTFFAANLALLVGACGGGDGGVGPAPPAPPPPPPPPPATPDIATPAAVVVPGGTIRLDGRAVSSGAIVSGIVIAWSSSDPSIAEVDAEGRVTGNALGEATITAAIGGATATATVEVVDEDFVEIAAGQEYTCGILAGGKAVCWGNNEAGHLGAGYEADPLRQESQLPPVPVEGELSFAKLGAHLEEHVCGTTTAGVAYCWGLDEFTALGAPTSKTCADADSGDQFGCSTAPLRVNTQVAFDWVSAFWDHSCGLTSAGEAYCWGDNGGGVLGVSGGERESPTAVETNLTFKALAATAHNTCGVASDGTVHCWGGAGLAVKGPGEADGSDPVAISGLPPMESLAGGRWHMCGLATVGRAFCWGLNHAAQLGAASQDSCPVNQAVVDCSFTPIEVVGNHRFTALTAGTDFTCGVTAAGEAYCWGDARLGKLGVDPSVGATVMNPVRVPGGHAFVAIESGDAHTCAITAASAVLCWGDNSSRQLGFETENTWSAEPIRVFGPR